MEGFVKDVRYSFRFLRQNRALTTAAIAALTLGIGANTAVFSIVNAVLLKPLSAPDPERMVSFLLTSPQGSAQGGAAQHFFFWREQINDFQDISAHRLELINLTGGSDPEQIPAGRVSADFFHLYGAAVIRGRTFTAEEDRPKAGHFAVLSYGLWTRRFGRDPQIVGKTIPINGDPYVVTGILGARFNSEQFDQAPDLWIPFQMDPQSTEGSCYCHVTGRLRPGITLAGANAHLQVAAEEFRRTFPRLLGRRMGFGIQPLQESMAGDVRSTLMIFVVAVVLVLLIACANVAGLMLASAAARGREIAIRAAIGAGRLRIVRQLLVESALLSLTAGVLGLVLGLACIRLILALYPSYPLLIHLNTINIPRIGEHGAAVGADWRVLVFTVVVSFLTTLLFGLIPAFQASRIDLSTSLKEGGGRSGSGFRLNKTRSLLVVGEIALALILVVGAALLVRTLIALRSVNPGFDSRNVLVMQMSLAGERFEKTSEIDTVIRSGLDRAHSLPGITAAATSCCIPLETVWQLDFVISGRPLQSRFHGIAGWTFISPEYFDAFHIPVLRGRRFTDRDNVTSPGVVIINEALAKVLWPNSDPLNDRLIIGRATRPEYNQDPIRQIVGIVGDIRDVGLRQKPRPAMYIPIAQLPDSINALNLRLLPVAWIFRTRHESQALTSAVKAELQQATGLPVARIHSMNEVEAQSAARTELNTLLMTIFGSSALLLAAIGIYGLIAYSVQQRTQEIGIRLALGAPPSTVRRMVIFQGIRLAGLGVPIGIASAAGLTRLIASLLFSVKPWDPAVFASVPMILIAVALFAVWFPARRATRIDPAEALRYE